MAVRPLGQRDRRRSPGGRDEIGDGGSAALAGKPRQQPEERDPGQAFFDGEAALGVDRQDARRRDRQLAVNRCQKLGKPGQGRNLGAVPEQANDKVFAVGEDLRLRAGIDEVGRLNPEFGEDVGRPLAGRSAQWTVRGESGRSSENAGMAMENISPCSFCIW
jgi:hypothetical protein